MFFCEIVRIAEAEPPYSFQTRKLKGKKGEFLSGQRIFSWVFANEKSVKRSGWTNRQSRENSRSPRKFGFRILRLALEPVDITISRLNHRLIPCFFKLISRLKKGGGRVYDFDAISLKRSHNSL
jgi:hypothetical protein